MMPYRLPSHAFQSGIEEHHQPLPLVPARNMTQLKTGKLQRTNSEDAERGDFFVVSDFYERYKVQPLSPFAATNHGVVRRTKIIPKDPTEDANGPIEDNRPQKEQDTFVVFGFANGDVRNAFVLGHIIPQVSQMQFKDIDLMDRHHTDNVMLVDNNGDMAEYSADGTGVVVAAPGKSKIQDHDPGHDGFKHFDEKDLPWGLKKKEDKEYTINQQSGGTRVHFDTKGNVVTQNENATVQVHDDGSISLTSSGPQGINTPKLTIVADTTHVHGDLHVLGNIVASNIQSQQGSVPGPISPAPAGSPSAGSPIKNTISQEKKPWKYG